MRKILVLALVVLIVMMVLPLAIAMGEMGDCPMCTSPKTLIFGICAGIVTAFMLVVVATSFRMPSVHASALSTLLQRSIFRPPRFA